MTPMVTRTTILRFHFCVSYYTLSSELDFCSILKGGEGAGVLGCWGVRKSLNRKIPAIMAVYMAVVILVMVVFIIVVFVMVVFVIAHCCIMYNIAPHGTWDYSCRGSHCLISCCLKR